MARNVRFKVNRAAVRDLLRSDEIARDLTARGEAAAAAAGPGFNVRTYRGRNRVHVTIMGVTPEARFSRSAQLRLIGALDAARLDPPTVP